VTERSSSFDAVGPVLETGELGHAIAQAIQKRYTSARILDRGAYLRVSVPQRCVVRRADVEEVLGRPFCLPGDLERVMPSFKGTLTIGDEEIVWAFQARSLVREGEGRER
jgi:toluene monooxygenase system protein D